MKVTVENNTGSVNNIENLFFSGLKRDSSFDSTGSNETASTLGVKRKKKVSYFCGYGKKEWRPSSHLITNNIDITKVLQGYRETNIALAEISNNLSDMRNLSLSHIFPVNNLEEENCITKFASLKSVKDAIMSIAYEDVKFQRASSEAMNFCKDTVDHVLTAFDPIDPIDVIVKKFCLQCRDNEYLIQNNSEASFIDKHLLPFLKEVFLKKSRDVVCGVIDAKDEQGNMADWKLGYNHKKKPRYAFFMEAKRPNTTSVYQADDDYVKLMKQMKTSIDFQVDLNLKNPKSFGLLVEGWRCKLYSMKLVEDGIYLTVMIKRFWLVEEFEQIINIPSIVEALMFIKKELQKFKDKLKSRDRSNGFTKFKKQTFYTRFEKDHS